MYSPETPSPIMHKTHVRARNEISFDQQQNPWGPAGPRVADPQSVSTSSLGQVDGANYNVWCQASSHMSYDQDNQSQVGTEILYR
jgi:hypothetical protein